MGKFLPNSFRSTVRIFRHVSTLGGSRVPYIVLVQVLTVLQALQMIPGIFFVALLPMLPRSPRWLASKDRWDEAISVLAMLHTKGNKQDPLILTEIREIKEKIEYAFLSSSLSTQAIVVPCNTDKPLASNDKPNPPPGSSYSPARTSCASTARFSPTSGPNSPAPTQ